MGKILVLMFFISSIICDSDDVLDMIKNSGYKGLSYEIETDDGYIVKIHRILPSHKIIRRNVTERDPILLMHGLSATSADFVMTGASKALAYMLSNNGYDVFMGNVRGSKHSMKHKNFSIESQDFWNFSFHEIGIYDISAMIDFVLSETKKEKIFYVGHSQGLENRAWKKSKKCDIDMWKLKFPGTTAFLALMSHRPEYQRKVLQGHLLAPAVFFAHLPNPFLKFIAGRVDEAFHDYAYLNLGSFWRILAKIRDTQCPRQTWKYLYCPELVFIYFQMFGANVLNLELDLVIAFWCHRDISAENFLFQNIIWELENHVSPRIGIKQVEHFSQLIQSKKFQLFDYKENNLQFYNSTEPPAYDLSNVKVPIFLYAAKEDLLVSVKVRVIFCTLLNIFFT